MQLCPLCGNSFLDDARFCPNDGSLLVAANDPYIGKVFLDQFEIREVCGRGSMGTVYKAQQTSMDREVAIKVLRRDLLKDSSIVKRFHREARAAARLSHPNIITVFMVGDTDDGAPFLAMEFVKGSSLATVCDEEGPLPPVRAIHIGRQITSALTEAHSQGVVHRDLKPENILLSNKPQAPDFVKVLDFGIAKIIRGDEESHLTQTGAIFGTPHYLAPEQASGGEVDHRADLYALGVILFQMVVGRLPFPSDSGMAVLVQHIQEQPPRPRELNRGIPLPMEQLILRALEKDPADRFQTADEFGEALGRVVDKLNFGSQTLLRVSTDSGVQRSDEGQAGATDEQWPASNKTKTAIPGTLEVKPAEVRPAAPEEPEDEALTGKFIPAAVPQLAPDPAPEPSLAPTLAEDEAVIADQVVQAVEQAQPAEEPADDDPLLSQPTEQEAIEPASVVTPLDDAETEQVDAPGQSTIQLARALVGRRRFFIQGLLGLGSMAAGGGVGYLFWRSRRARAEVVDPPGMERPEPAPDQVKEGQPGDEAPPRTEPPQGEPPGAEPSPAKAPPRPSPRRKTTRRPRRKARPRRQPARKATPAPRPVDVPPAGPTPKGVPTGDHGNDDRGDHGDPVPRPAAKPKAPPPPPGDRLKVKKKAEDMYELVD